MNPVISTYFKAQLRAEPVLHDISDEAAYAMVEALCLVPQLERPRIERLARPTRFNFDLLDFQILSRGKKPKHRLSGPWAAGSDLNEWAEVMFAEIQDDAQQREQSVVEIASRLPTEALPVLARTMAFSAAFDRQARRQAIRSPRDIGEVRQTIHRLAEQITADAVRVDEWIAAGIDARTRSFDYMWAAADGEHTRWSFRADPDASPEDQAAAWNTWKSIMADGTVYIDLDDVTGGEIEPELAGWLVLQLNDDANQLIFEYYSTLAPPVLDALNALDGATFVPHAQDENPADVWSQWQVVENGADRPDSYLLLSPGEYVKRGDAARLCAPSLRGCYVLNQVSH